MAYMQRKMFQEGQYDTVVLVNILKDFEMPSQKKKKKKNICLIPFLRVIFIFHSIWPFYNFVSCQKLIMQ